jgi:predicted glycosyltransferase
VPHLREPVQVNLALREFVDRSFRRDPTVHSSGDGRPRALFVSAPIGLGHAQRDVAVARELRKLVPDLQVDWLAQDPVTRVLEAEGEHIHPASEHLASESKHWESECAEHDLHAFEAMRRMDEILAANFMLFRDVVADTRYDLWVADEMWDIDYYLHENPNEKRAPYAWMTDFVGFVPMSDGGEREAFLAADYNAQMVEHIAAHPTLRDRSIYIGDPEDLISEPLGPDLPSIRDWTQANFECAGYITGFDPAQFADRDALRAELGYGEDEQVCIVTVGGTNVGIDLLRRVVAAAPLARERVPNLRMIVVAGPRIDRHALDAPDGVEVLPYVHHLYRNLAACDLAVVQGGLSTSMELTANRRPFLSFPLKHHFEQQVHVRHRVQRYGAARFMDYDSETPETIADAIAADIGRDVHCRDVETDGARLAAQHIAELLN